MTIYTAKRTPIHRGPAAWSAILPGQAAPLPLQSDLKADVTIIGAGFAGLAAARRLRQLQPTANVVVIDASRIAEGAAGRNSGFMIDLPHEITTDSYAGSGATSDRAVIARNRQAITFTRSAVEDYGIDKNFFDPVGKVNGAASERSDGLNKSFAQHLSALNEPHEYLDAKSMYAMTGSHHYVSGLFAPGTVMIQPAGLVRGLAEGLRRDGVQIFENSPVVSVARETTGWSVATAKHKINTEKLIFANNGQLESFGFAQQRLMHIFLYASMTVDMTGEDLKQLGGAPRWGITPSDPMGTTMRRIDTPLGGNRIVTRTCASFLPGMVASETALKRTAAVHRQKFDQRFPQLKHVKMEHSWAGHLCLSRNGVAVVKELDRNLFSACVQNGLGTVRGTLTGIAAAELACGQPSDIAQHFAAEPEPTKLLPPPLSTLGANAYLRVREAMIRSE